MLQATDWQIARKGLTNTARVCVFAAATALALPNPAFAQTDATPAVAEDTTLTWHGITVYGTYDVGVGWVSHGLPVSPYNYEGESLINRNGNQAQWLIAPNNLSQTGLGIRGREEVMPG